MYLYNLGAKIKYDKKTGGMFSSDCQLDVGAKLSDLDVFSRTVLIGLSVNMIIFTEPDTNCRQTHSLTWSTFTCR